MKGRKKRNIVLASASPRRKALLEQIGIDHTVRESIFDERVVPYEGDPHAYTKELSYGKAFAVAETIKSGLVIGADTVVVLGNEILGKPGTKREAKRMLERLSGVCHRVVTGFTIFDASNGLYVSESCETRVCMRDLSADEIDAYVRTGEPLDKAGGYGIQERGAAFVVSIEGDHGTVVGLPLSAFMVALRRFE